MLRVHFELHPAEGTRFDFIIDIVNLQRSEDAAYLVATNAVWGGCGERRVLLPPPLPNEPFGGLVARAIDRLWPEEETGDSFCIEVLERVQAITTHIQFVDEYLIRSWQLQAWTLDCHQRPLLLRVVLPGAPGQTQAVFVKEASTWQRFLLAVQCLVTWGQPTLPSSF